MTEVTIYVHAKPTEPDGPSLPAGYVVPPPTLRWGEELIDGPTWLYQNHTMFVKWQRPGGDYWDSALALNGPAHWASTGAPSTANGNKTFDVTSMMPRLLQDNTGFYFSRSVSGGNTPRLTTREALTSNSPKLTVVTSTGTVVLSADADVELASNTNNCLGTGTTGHIPYLVHFDLSALTGTVTSASLMINVESAWSVSQTYYVDQLAMAKVIYDPPKQCPKRIVQGIANTVMKDSDLANHPSVLSYNEFKSDADCWQYGTAGALGKWNAISSNYDAAPHCGYWDAPYVTPGREYVDWPFYGISALRLMRPAVPINGDNSSISRAFKDLHRAPWSYPYGAGPREMYARYLFKIDHAVYDGINEGGVKMPGMDGNTLAGSDKPNGPPGGGSWAGGYSGRMQHGGKSPSNPHLWEMRGYHYDSSYAYVTSAQGSQGVGDLLHPNIPDAPICVSDRVHCVEQHIRLNTSTNVMQGTSVVTINTAGSISYWNNLYTQRRDTNDTSLWWNQDGLLEFWLDGVLIFRDAARGIVANKYVDIGSVMWSNFYHGGTALPIGTLYYEWSGVCAATEYIGPPKLL